jgi:hypothetical protein
MKADVNGCSTVVAGAEQYEAFNSPRGKRIQYKWLTESQVA